MYSALQNTIKEVSVLKHYNSSENSFYIKEDDRLAKCKRVTLMHFEAESTTFGFELDCKKIKCERLHKLSPYFQDGKDLDKGNDAIIFTTIESKNYIFVVELKDDSNSREIIKQFKSTTCFIDYLKSILKNIYKIKLDDINIKYLVFSTHGNNLKLTKTTKLKPIEKDDLSIFHLNCEQAKISIRSFI